MSTNGITNAVARLTRAGDENSRTTEKLREAAGELERLVADLPGVLDLPLPRGYRITTTGRGLLELLDNTGCRCGANGDRVRFLMLASDVAEGWLDELAAMLEARAIEADRAAGLLAEKWLFLIRRYGLEVARGAVQAERREVARAEVRP